MQGIQFLAPHVARRLKQFYRTNVPIRFCAAWSLIISQLQTLACQQSGKTNMLRNSTRNAVCYRDADWAPSGMDTTLGLLQCHQYIWLRR